jgi:hypothetical protein
VRAGPVGGYGGRDLCPGNEFKLAEYVLDVAFGGLCEIISLAAMPLLVRPWTIRSATCLSRGVRMSASLAERVACGWERSLRA